MISILEFLNTKRLSVSAASTFRSPEASDFDEFFSETAMNLLAGESVDGESALQFVAAEMDIKDIFFEAEENDGRNRKARGILPVLVLFNALNWASIFPSIPTVISGPLADTLCDLSP